MTIPDILLHADRDRCFADWGVAIVYREVSLVFNPLTQQAVETHTDTELTAIVGQGSTGVMKTTAGRAVETDLVVWIKPEELPSEATTSRVVFDGNEYRIVSLHHREREPYCELHCRRC